MTEQLKIGVVGITDGHEVAAALEADGVELIGFWGEDEATRDELAALYGVKALPLSRQLFEADLMLVGAGLADSDRRLAAMVAADKPLLLTADVLGRADAVDWLTLLADAVAPVGVALAAAVDDGLAYCRDLVRGGILGELLGVEVRVAAPDDSAWALLAEQLGAALWVTEQTPVALNALRKASAGAHYVAALVETSAGVPCSLSLRAGVPGGAQDDQQSPWVLGERAQLILAPKPLGWFAAASESNRSQQWDKLVYAGARGSLSRGIAAFAAAVQANEPLPMPLGNALDVARVLAALRGVSSEVIWGTS